MIAIFLPFVSLIFIALSFSQEEKTLSSQTDFRDGVYFSASDFRFNKPALPIDSFNFSERPSDGNHKLFLYNFDFVESRKDALDTIWGICIDGAPYINQSRLSSARNGSYDEDFTNLEDRGSKPIVFVKIMFIGHLCHFTIESSGKRYNPVMSPGRVKNKKTRFKQKILKASTGEISNFTAENFQKLIVDDAELSTQYIAIPPSKRDDQIFRFFHLYNERNKLVID